MSAWGKDCWCTGAGNLLPNGCCGKRFSCWLDSCPDVTVDHRYVYSRVGYNLQPLDVQGALGLVQMDKLEAIHTARRNAFRRIEDAFMRQSWRVRYVKQLEEAKPSWFGVPLLCEDYETKQALVTHLEAAGVQTRNMFAGNILLHPGYAHLGRAADYPHAQEVLKRVLFIGCHPALTDAHFAHIEATLKTFNPPTCTSTS